MVGVGNRWLVLVIAFACGGSARRLHAPAVITVLDPGAEPRVRLRYEPKLHARERLEINLKIRMTAAFTNTVLEDGRSSLDLPTARIIGRLEVADVAPNGEVVINYVVEEATVLDDLIDPGVRAPFEKEVVAIKGWRSSWRMSPSGVRTHIAVNTTNGAGTPTRSSDIHDSIRDAWVMFPDPAIGVGATWKVTSRESFERAEWDRTVTYRLRHLEAASATVDAEVVLRASEQALSTEPNASTKLTSGTSTSVVQMSIPRHGLVPTGTSRRSGELNFLFVEGRLRIISTIQSETLFSVRPMPNVEPDPSP